MYESKVSIVIPVYNGSQYLKEAIDSALSQTYRNTEVIVVNDGSDDGGKTEKIAKSYGKKIRYFFKENSGVASALNLGIKKMTGEWFSWLSHDDVYFEDKIAKQLSFANRQREARFIYSQHISIDENGEEIRRGFYQWTPDGKIPQARQLLKGNCISGCTTLIHRSCFEKVGLFNINNKTAQDYEMWILMSVFFRFYHCPEVVLKRRIHPEMGNIVFGKQNEKDVKTAIRNADTKLTLQQIFPDKLTKNSSSDLTNKCHIELGDFYLLNHGLMDLAKRHYAIVRKMRYGLGSSILWRLFLGRTIYSLKQFYKRTYNAVGSQVLCLLRKA